MSNLQDPNHPQHVHKASGDHGPHNTYIGNMLDPKTTDNAFKQTFGTSAAAQGHALGPDYDPSRLRDEHGALGDEGYKADPRQANFAREAGIGGRAVGHEREAGAGYRDVGWEREAGAGFRERSDVGPGAHTGVGVKDSGMLNRPTTTDHGSVAGGGAKLNKTADEEEMEGDEQKVQQPGMMAKIKHMAGLD